ncbi:MAG: hypothetical protein WCK88_01055 [bacterium]
MSKLQDILQDYKAAIKKLDTNSAVTFAGVLPLEINQKLTITEPWKKS